MTVSRADRQIYLHWQQGRKKSSAKPCPASGLRQAGLGGNPDRLAPPRAGHIPLCCPWPCSELSARWDQSFTGPRLTHSHISPWGRESREEEAGRESRTQRAEGCCWCTRETYNNNNQKKKKQASSFLFLPLVFLPELLMRQAAPAHLSLPPRGGQRGRSVCRFSSVCDFILQLLNTGTVL